MEARQFWKVLGNAGLISKKLSDNLPKRSEWKISHTKKLGQELILKKLFITNLVKCCYSNSRYPGHKVIQKHIKFLKEEIRIVNPKKIIAFGTLVYYYLTGKNVKLSDYWKEKRKRGFTININTDIISGLMVPVFPVYSPVGRGNPKKSVETLSILNKFYNKY